MRYKQKHPETCLAKCLMILLEKRLSKQIPGGYELELGYYFLKHGRESIARAILQKVIKDFNISLDWFADSKVFFDFIKKEGFIKRISLTNKKVGLKLVDSVVDQPFAIYLDRFYLWQKSHGLYYKYHWPHWIIINKKMNNNYEIIDPDDGKIKLIPAKILSKAIVSLRNHLWMSPQIIKINKR